MDSFYVTLPSNASMNIYPDNKKSNYTTQFNTPIRLDGNYEVALANITCTPNIRNDYGVIRITNFYRLLYPFLPPDAFPLIPLKLKNVKNIADKINELQEQVVFVQVFLNTLFYQAFAEQQFEDDTQDAFKDLVPIFFNLSKINDTDFNYYIPQNLNLKFDDMVRKENTVNKTIKIENNNAVLTREQFNYLVEDNFELLYYPMLVFDGLVDHTMATEIAAYYEKKLNDNALNHKIFDKYIFQFKKTYATLVNSIHFTGLVNIKAEIKNDQIKFSSNLDLELKAEGIIKDLVFQNDKIMLDTYYTLPGNLNLIKYGIIYCDIIQEQIVGEDYRQVLQIIPLNSNEGSQVLSNNLDLQYVPVKSNFINSINISIKSLTGDFIKFDDDFIYTIVKLHFRKIL